jgi:transcriptional regulator with XRE-family HTH domain
MAARPSEIGPAGVYLGAEVTRRRGLRGWDQRALVAELAAVGVEVSQPVLSRIESGVRRVDADELVALAAAFRVPVSALLPVRDEEDVPAPVRHAATGDEPGPVGTALAEDIEALGDLAGMEPTLAATAVRLARQIDGLRPVPCDECGSLVHIPADPRILPQLTRELRATVATLLEGRTVDDEDDDGLGDLGSV